MKYPVKPQPVPVVRFRVNGGGVHVFFSDNRAWVRADSAIMTDVATVLYNMVKFTKKF
jgi:hypothetical protein